MKNYLILSYLLFTSQAVLSQVEVKYFNDRFVWISVPSKYVKARLNYPVDGYSVCWIEVKTKKENFDFVLRRGLPFKNCLKRVLDIRALIKSNDVLEIVGDGGSKEKKGDYYSMWEIIRGKSGCEGYFGGCRDFEKDNPDWKTWASKPINQNLYP